MEWRDTMRKKIVLLCGLGILFCGVVTGCGREQSGNETAPTATAQSTPESVTTVPAPTVPEETDDAGDDEDLDQAASGGTASAEPVTNTNKSSAVPKESASSQKSDSSATGTGASNISKDEATQIALDRVKGAKTSDVRIHSEWDDGREIYEGSIVYKGKEYDFEIDATNGEILEWEEESIDD